MTKREEEALNTKNKIIESAKKVVNEKGIKNTSIEDITKDADVAKGTFYTYFKSKEDILKELVCKDEFEYNTDFLNEPLKKKISIFNQNTQSRIQSSGIKICRSWIANNTNNDSQLNYDLNIIRNIIKSSIKDGELDETIDVERYSNLIVNINYGQMLNWCMTDGKYNPTKDVDKTADMIIDLFKKYLKKES